MPNAALFRPREPYKRCIKETFQDFPPSSFPLIDTLLAIDPAERMTATDALKSEVTLKFVLFVFMDGIIFARYCSFSFHILLLSEFGLQTCLSDFVASFDNGRIF